ncbi:MAG: sigma-70 family RNA polymerase sigma factor [Abitibacteriaceae bacterium]|nr:sigma-70 family RNA polymerase sigma factor [Abditibacteriaceae bacterium]
MIQDWQLIREYVENGSQAAFTIIVERYVNLVYSTCLRELRDPSLAEDVTQVVFVILARKASTLREGTLLSGWLFNTARFASKNALKQEMRRQQRERKAVEDMIGETRTQDASWAQLEPLLHDALSSLGGDERNALLLRFFEGKSFKETAQSLNVSTDAAEKRVARALDKMRRYFSRHGYVVPLALLGSLLADHAVRAAPVGCAAIVTQVVAQVTSGVAGGAAGTLTAQGIAIHSTAARHIAAHSVTGSATSTGATGISASGASTAGASTAMSATGGTGAATVAASGPVTTTAAATTTAFGSSAGVGATGTTASGVMASGVGASSATAELAGVKALSLSEGVLKAMLITKIKLGVMACVGLTLGGTGAGHLAHLAIAAVKHLPQPNLAQHNLTQKTAEPVSSTIKHHSKEAMLHSAVLYGARSPHVRVQRAAVAQRQSPRLLLADATADTSEAETSKPETNGTGDNTITPATGLPQAGLRAGEIQVEGRLRSVNLTKQQLVLEVSSFTLPTGKTSELTEPKPKTVIIGKDAALHVRGDEKQKVNLDELANSPDGVFAIVVGKDLGSGKDLPARDVALWDRIEAGLYRFKDSKPLIATTKDPEADATGEPSGVGPGHQAVGADEGAIVTDKGRGKGRANAPLTADQAAKAAALYQSKRADVLAAQADAAQANAAAQKAGIAATQHANDPAVDFAPAENLLPQGNFEEIDEAGKPVGWNVHGNVKVLTEPNGNHYVLINGLNPTDPKTIDTTIVIDPALRALRILARMKTTNLQLGDKPYENAHVGITFKDRQDKVLGYAEAYPTLTHDSDWIVLSTVTRISPGTHHLYVDAGIWGPSGQLAVDDITIVPAKVPSFGNVTFTPRMPQDRGLPATLGDIKGLDPYNQATAIASMTERLNPQGRPLGSMFSDPTIGQVGAENDNHFLRLTSTDPEGEVMVRYRVPVDPAQRKLLLLWRMRVNNLLPKANDPQDRMHLDVTFENAKGKTISGPATLLTSLGAPTWTPFHLYVDTPTDAAAAVLSFGLHQATGTFDLDDFLVMNSPPTVEQVNLLLAMGYYQTANEPRYANGSPGDFSITGVPRPAPGAQAIGVTPWPGGEWATAGFAPVPGAAPVAGFAFGGAPGAAPGSATEVAPVALPTGEVGVATAAFPGGDVAISPLQPMPVELPNGNFENPEAGGNTAGWNLSDLTKAKVLTENGNHFLRLTNDSPFTTVSATILHAVDPAWKTLKVSGVIRTSNLKVDAQAWNGAHLEVTFMREDKSMAAPSFQYLRNDRDWTPLSLVVPVLPGAEQVQITVSLNHAAGIADFDAIGLTANVPLTNQFVGVATAAPGQPAYIELGDPKTGVGTVMNVNMPGYQATARQMAGVAYVRSGTAPTSRFTPGTMNQAIGIQAKEADTLRAAQLRASMARTPGVDIPTAPTAAGNRFSVNPGTAQWLQGLSPAAPNQNADPNEGDAEVQPQLPAFVDGTFENTGEDGNPAGWVLRDHTHTKIAEEDGNHFLHLVSDDPPYSVGVADVVHLKPDWKTLKIKLRLRAHIAQCGPAAGDGARLDLSFYRTDNTPLPNVQELANATTKLTLKQDSPWSTREVVLTIPPGATQLVLRPMMQQSTGTADFDDIRVIGNPQL